MSGGWNAVSKAITERMTRLNMQQSQLAKDSGVSQATIRELQYNTEQRRRSPRTLSAISKALGEPGDFLQHVFMGAEQNQGPQGATLTLSDSQEKLLKQLLSILEHRLGPTVDVLYNSDPKADITIQIRRPDLSGRNSPAASSACIRNVGPPEYRPRLVLEA